MESELISDQREQRAADAPAPADQPQPGHQLQPSAPRGRPWVKGQSGNPAGRPPRRHHVAAVVAQGMITRKTVPLTEKLINLALAGDRTALRLCLDRLAPRRPEMPLDLQLPPIEQRADLLPMMMAVADAAARGSLSSAQSAALLRMLTGLYYTLR